MMLTQVTLETSVTITFVKKIVKENLVYLREAKRLHMCHYTQI